MSMQATAIDAYGIGIFQEDEETVQYLKCKYQKAHPNENIDDLLFCDLTEWLNGFLSNNYVQFIGEEDLGQFFHLSNDYKNVLYEDEAYEYRAPAMIVTTTKSKALVGMAYNSVSEILEEMNDAVGHLLPKGYICEDNLFSFIGIAYT